MMILYDILTKLKHEFSVSRTIDRRTAYHCH